MTNKRLKNIKERLNSISDQEWKLLKRNTITLRNNPNQVMGYIDMQSSEGRDFVLNAANDIEWLLNYVEQLENSCRNLDLESQRYFDLLVEKLSETIKNKEETE